MTYLVDNVRGRGADALTRSAGEYAEAAARRLGLQMAELRNLDELRPAAELLRYVWGAPSSDQLINVDLMRALAFSGNYVVGAYRHEKLVGCGVAFFGVDHLHSHVLGVEPAVQNKGVGFAIKHHQRSWALERGITTIRWTFDPLVRRNAHFNLNKLGATVIEYIQDFYGDVDDGINTGDTTDRLLVGWDLTSPAGAASPGGRGGPVDVASTPSQTHDRLVIPLPPDIESLRRRNRREATRWRYQMRAALTEALVLRYRVVGLTDDGSYLLVPGSGCAKDGDACG